MDINDEGTIVGWARGADLHVYAVVWQNEQIVDLNTIESVPDGWVLSEARSINNLGQIVGQGGFAGENRPFLLTPRDAVKSVFFDNLESGDTSKWSFSK